MYFEFMKDRNINALILSHIYSPVVFWIFFQTTNSFVRSHVLRHTHSS